MGAVCTCKVLGLIHKGASIWFCKVMSANYHQSVTYNERVQIRHKAIVRILTIQYDMAQTVELIIMKKLGKLNSKYLYLKFE